MKNAFAAGEIGLPYIIQTAAQNGMNDLTTAFITRSEHPSYYAFVLDGTTTLGEYWETNPRSHCYDMMGHIIGWYYNGIAGIRLLEPGFAKIVIRPFLPEGMHSFSCSYESVRGSISVRLQEYSDHIDLTVCVPKQISGTLDLSLLKETGKEIRVLLLWGYRQLPGLERPLKKEYNGSAGENAFGGIEIERHAAQKALRPDG